VKVLVVGNGGREHALAWALARSPRVTRVHVAPGNGGTAGIAVNVPIAPDDIPALAALAISGGFDLVVIGPEAPLALGLADRLRAAGVPVFGPDAAAARLESSKVFSKSFMRDNGIPTAEAASFDDYDAAQAYLDGHPAPIVIKADGLAAGKGVIVCQTEGEARKALQRIMKQRVFGPAGDRVLIEEHLRGQEISVLAFADGGRAVPMLMSQDHKAAWDGDRGPNTGGMGCYAPAPLLDAAMQERVQREVLQPAMEGMRRLGAPYVGVLYAGLMVLADGYRVLEFNCRFGDPEAQVLLPLLETDLVDVIESCVEGRLDQMSLAWKPRSCACVVMASGGYPGPYQTGHEIGGLEDVADLDDVIVFHAGTRRERGRVFTSGGRVLGVTALGDTLRGAVDRAYEAVRVIHWPDAAYRTDIGAKGLRALAH
jgi:phosphoribosylamine--glycine ligase